jgi:hypothetical protein
MPPAAQEVRAARATRATATPVTLAATARTPGPTAGHSTPVPRFGGCGSRAFRRRLGDPTRHEPAPARQPLSRSRHQPVTGECSPADEYQPQHHESA